MDKTNTSEPRDIFLVSRHMSTTSGIITSVLICAAAAGLEGVCAGKNVKPYFARLRWPAYSPPLWVWYIVGGLYYVICFAVLLRVLTSRAGYQLRILSILLLLSMMTVNALWNFVFFRMQNLWGSFVIGLAYPALALALLACLLSFDVWATWFLTPYLLYQVYAVFWGYRVWRVNTR